MKKIPSGMPSKLSFLREVRKKNTLHRHLTPDSTKSWKKTTIGNNPVLSVGHMTSSALENIEVFECLNEVPSDIQISHGAQEAKQARSFNAEAKLLTPTQILL